MWYDMIILFEIVGAVTSTECPMVQQCNNCEYCMVPFEPYKPSTLTCYFDKVSEKLDLHWTFEDNDVEYNETQLKIKNEKSGTWNISSTILFVSNTSSCDQNQTFVCYAKNDGQMVTKTNRTVYIKPNNCEVNIKLIIVGAVIGMASLGLLVLVLIKLPCCKKDTLMESLKQIYIPFGEYWCGDCQYELTYTDRSNITMNTVDELLASLSKDHRDQRVLFIGESGIGKSRLFRTMAKKWMDGDILQDEILIYLQLDSLSKDSNILEALHASLKHDKNSVTIDSLRMKLQNTRSIVMLDGLSNLDRFHNTTQNNDITNGLTVEQLLIGKDIVQYKKMKIWITCRYLKDALKDMKDKVTTVELFGFNDPQRDSYFARAFSVDENSMKDISDTWKCYIEGNYNEILDGRYSSPLIAQLFVRYYSQKNMIELLMKFTRSKWNYLEKVDNFDLLVCLLEAFFQDKDEYTERAKTFHQKQLVFRHITDDYFQEATLHLWQALNDNDRQLKTLEIYGDFPVRLMKYLPTVTEQLVFHNIPLSENYNDYKSLTETALKKCNTVKFSDITLHNEHIATA